MVQLSISDRQTKSEIIQYFAQELGFAEYWQPNWDSFEECLAETLKSGQKITLHITGSSDCNKEIEELIEIVTDFNAEFGTISIEW